MLLTCDAIKIGYRQSKDGFVVLFAIHPQEMPEDLANAELGSQWQLKLVPLDNDGNPQDANLPTAKEMRGILKQPDAGAASPQAPVREEGPQPIEPQAVAVPASRPLNLANHIGMLCANSRFHYFLMGEFEDRWQLLNTGTSTEKAAVIVRSLCGVKSRSDIENNPEALAKWKLLFNCYSGWQRSNPF